MGMTIETRSAWVHKGVTLVAAMVLGLLTGCGGNGDGTATPIAVSTLSNRADLISGGDALVEVQLPANADAATLRVRLNGADISSAFTKRADGRILGLLTGLTVGTNELSADLGGAAKVLTITNYPIGGPVFSGPQVQPWICETQAAGLAAATNAQCNAPTVVDYLYKPTGSNALVAYDTAHPPANVSTVTTDSGKTVPYIVRRETGTMDRGIYSVAVLADPTKAYTPWSPPDAWNRKLYYVMQGGFLPQQRQGPLPTAGFGPQSNVLADVQLGKGFVVASSSLNVFTQNMNTITAAEALMMLKEHVIESFGDISYTISYGPSGASMQQHIIANSYPGLLDGIQPVQSFPDAWTVENEAQDCSLLVRYFDQTAPQSWGDQSQQNAVFDNANGQSPGTCRAWVTLHRLDSFTMDPASTSCFITYPPGTTSVSGTGAGVTPVYLPWMYDPILNPAGARCTFQDFQVALFGKRQDNFANRPYDNTGVQYGLKALATGSITAEQFVDLNEKVGGRDINWKWTASRSAADAQALTAVYRSGQVMNGQNLTIPIFDYRLCNNSEIHSCFHSLETRARLQSSIGTSANQVLFTVTNPATVAQQFDLLDKWVAAYKADNSADSSAVKVLRAKPAAAVDSCWINGQQVTDAATCALANPTFGDPRTGAGGSIRSDIMKCQLMPLNRSTYNVSFTDAQWGRLATTFPSGVCDWSKPSVGAEPVQPWLTLSAGAPGSPLGPAPTSH
jgi:hypothetical protein